jgi:hypothetical protein
MGSDVARIKDMIVRRSRGETLAMIAEAHGVTRERVRQLIKKAGGPSAEVAQVAKSTARHRADQDLLESVRAAMKAGTFEARKIAKQIGVPETEVRRVAKPSDRRKFVRHVMQPKKWSEAAILKAIEAAAAGNSRITVMDYEAARKSGRANGPTVAVVIHRFGSWVAAVGRLGLKASRVSGRGRSITKAQALGNLVSYFGRAGARVTAANYERWAGKNNAASLGTIRNIFGSWSEAKLQAQKAIARHSSEGKS